MTLSMANRNWPLTADHRSKSCLLARMRYPPFTVVEPPRILPRAIEYARSWVKFPLKG